MPSPFREWGDGATDRRPHVIEDISYTSNVIACRCGAYIRGSSPEALSVAWVAHGGAVLRLSDSVERGAEPVVSAQDRAGNAVAALAFVGARCTCAPGSDITTCPNYVSGDEYGDFSDDDEAD